MPSVMQNGSDCLSKRNAPRDEIKLTAYMFSFTYCYVYQAIRLNTCLTIYVQLV